MSNLKATGESSINAFRQRKAIPIVIRCLVASCLGHQLLANQIANGNFSNGNSGFTTQYEFVAANGTVRTGPGEIALTTNPSSGFANGYSSYTDHSGNAGGLMLFVDGLPGSNFWAQVVTVQAHKDYTFDGWVASAYPANPAVLVLFADGTPVGPAFTAPVTAAQWTKWTVAFNSGTATSLSLSLQDINSDPFELGNDATIDDLSLDLSPPTGTEATPEPTTLALIVVGVALALRQRSRHIVHN
jgi:hypothetical protein